MGNRSILLYNLFPRTTWKEVTRSLLATVPHDEIAVHVTLPWYAIAKRPFIARHLRQYPKITRIFYSINSRRKGESVGFEKLRRRIDFSPYAVATYIHSKGTSRKRKNTAPVRDWTELMRYFTVERLDLCTEAFGRGYALFGVELSTHVWTDIAPREMFPDTRFIYQGNFVCVNLHAVREEFLTYPCKPHYYALERFWGTLCPLEKAYCAHRSTVDHYTDPYPRERYNRSVESLFVPHDNTAFGDGHVQKCD
jgi:hypothetical protein